jgi:hypothetical protein
VVVVVVVVVVGVEVVVYKAGLPRRLGPSTNHQGWVRAGLPRRLGPLTNHQGWVVVVGVEVVVTWSGPGSPPGMGGGGSGGYV